MEDRKLQIAWSIAWGVVAVLLCALWVRSYSRADYINHTNSKFDYAGVRSDGGQLIFFRNSLGGSQPGWDYNQSKPLRQFRGFGLNWTGRTMNMPSWCPALLIAALSVAPWIPQLRFRFSLGTLLIVTTLIAVGLGVIAWVAR